jgi:mannose-6-phosphate isomerase-like protein (cupin superfamily)
MHVTRYAELEPFTTKDGSTIRELMRTSQQSLAEAQVGPGQSTTRHYHARTEELYAFLEGGGEFELDGERREVAAGDTMLIPPGARHTIKGGPAGARFLCCCVPAYSHDDTFLVPAT